MKSELPKALRWAAICGVCSAIAFFCWSGGSNLDQRVARIVTDWKKTEALVLATATRTITTKNRTEHVYPSTVAFRHGGGNDIAQVELVFYEPKRVGEVVEIYYDPSRSSFSRDDVESVERIAVALSATRRAVSDTFLAVGIVSAIAALACLAFHFRALQPTKPRTATAEATVPVPQPSRPPDGHGDVREKLRSPDRSTRLEALNSLQASEDATAFSSELARIMTADPSASVRDAASRAAVRVVGGEKTVDTMVAMLSDSDPRGRQMAVVALSCMGSSIRERLMPLLQSKDPAVRKATLEILHRFEMWSPATEA